ncbi:MAG: hypothetical protein CO017_03330 [Zetaproteobacteria bacterium CG_4_8_14_3_um_filter_59_5]|nr:MAG: hypothetical protein COX56_00415 [Zetaproteobacteria bacterium CG23_combo_of_CG06-09_8_20_14_all_59_86]PIU96623.1 MAG: hypothetical protein COS62_07725 [Zetaproteobacteria bacterium CG03_land_8_20_14_0_80_59_51]PJC70828.1 MAG: hypothetical protein CO017_03330 [Zetaproteobacteria bacterium CG_4_8_14_3_um_filter_59_5]
MESWLEIVLRQIIMYSLPMLISLSVVGMAEARAMRQPMRHAFYALSWCGSWLPWLACIVFNRAVIFALPRPAHAGLPATLVRFAAHGVLCLLGYLLYIWSLTHPAAMGLPPLHYWWAKVLMFFNLCMLGIHLLPLPGMLLGEWLLPRFSGTRFAVFAHSGSIAERKLVLVWVLLGASSLPDAILGTYVIFPVYGDLATWAAGMAR